MWDSRGSIKEEKVNLSLRMTEAPRMPYGSASDSRKMSTTASDSVDDRPTKRKEEVVEAAVSQ
jgi:hypothetical protein